MNTTEKKRLIMELVERAEKLPILDENELDSIRTDGEMILRKLFGAKNDYIRSMSNIMFLPMTYPTTINVEHITWNEGQRRLINLLSTAKKELELFESEAIENKVNIEQSTSLTSKRIFVVHGHDNEMKLDVARTIEKLGLEAVILHEQDDEGKTVIEKFETNSIDCNFAVILLSPDDYAYKRTEDAPDGKYRARQNVILELGYFVGKISRKNVMSLVKNDSTGDLEIPSDLAGLVYTEYDQHGGWKQKLFRNLVACGYELDANNLF